METDTFEFSDYGEFVADCPARAALDLFAHTWLPVVVFVLRDGPMRPSQMQKEIGGVSQKVLNDTLQLLERRRLVARHRYREAPPRVEYQLTAAGRDLLVPILTLGQWARRYADELTPQE